MVLRYIVAIDSGQDLADVSRWHDDLFLCDQRLGGVLRIQQ